MVVGRILAYLLSAAFVESAVTDRQGGNRYFDFNEQTALLTGMSPEFNFARQQPASDDQTFGRRLTSSESLRHRTPHEPLTKTRPSQGKDTFGISRQSLEFLRRDNNLRNSITPSDSPTKQERTNFLSGEKLSSREISPKFHSVPNNRQQGRRTYETISQERTTQRSDETFLTDRDPHEVPVGPTFRQLTPTIPPMSQERTSSRPEQISFLEDEEKPSDLRSGSRERLIIRPTSSQESSTLRSEETFLTDKDPPEVPVRQTFRQLSSNDSPLSRERATSRSEETFREVSPNSRTRLNFRDRFLSANRPLPAVTAGEDRSFRQNEESFLTDNKRTNSRERQNETRNASPTEQEQSPARTEATFLTDEEDFIYFPDGQDAFFPRPPTRQKEEKQNKPSRSEEAFLTDKEDFSNVFPNPNRKVSSSNKDRSGEDTSSPRSEETFLTDDDDLEGFLNRPNNRNQKDEDTSQRPEERPDELFLSEEGPLPPKDGRYKVISTVAPSSQENDVEDNFLIDNDPNPLPAPAHEDNTAPPKHLGRVRWPPPKNLEESAEAKEKAVPTLPPLFYEDTMGIKTPAIRHSLEKEGNEGIDRNREKVDKIHADSGEDENESEEEEENSYNQDNPPSREEYEGAPESEENGEGHPQTSHENNENHGSSRPNDESEADPSREENNEPDEDFDPLSDDFEENHEEENQDLEAFPPLDNHEEHDSEESPPEGQNQEESPPEHSEDSAESPPEHTEDAAESPREHTEDSAESPPEHTEDSAESPPEHTEDSAESPPEHTEDSAESPPEHTEDSAESPPEHTEDSAESPPEHTEDSAESPPEHTEDSAESPPEDNPSSSEDNHDSEESSPDDTNGSEETPHEDSQEYLPDNTNNSDESPPEENHDSGESSPEVNHESEERPPEGNQNQEDPSHEVVDSDNSIPNNEIESEETPPEQNNFSLEELFPTESEEQVYKPESNSSARFPNKKLKPQGANENPHFGAEETPSTESLENAHLEGDGLSGTEYEDDSPKSSEENHDPDYPDGPKRRPNYEDNRLRPSGSFGEDPNKDSQEENFSPEFNLDSFEFDLDVLEAPPSSELGSPTSPKPTPPARPTSIPADCSEGDEEGSTAQPFDFKKAKKPIKTVKPERRPGDEVSITVSGPTVRVRTTKRTTTTTTPRPVTISALGVVNPGGEIIAKVVKPTMTSGPQASPVQVESPNKKATTTKTTPWKAVLAAREATALTYLKPPPVGQPQTWFMTAPPPSPMFRLFVV